MNTAIFISIGVQKKENLEKKEQQNFLKFKNINKNLKTLKY